MRAAIIGSNIRMEGILNFAVFRQGIFLADTK
jgi:hypothetical protein